MVLFTIFIGFCFVFMILFIKHYINRQRHPPGPLGLPILGLKHLRILQIILTNILPKMPLPTKYLSEMKKKYGDIWSFEIGRQKYIVLASIDVITEAFVHNGKLYSERPEMEYFRLMCENRGIIFIGGQLWQDNRQMAIKALRDLGMGKRNLENDICDESHELIEYIKKNSLSSFTSPSVFIKPVSNVINKLVFNERNSYDDPEMNDYLANLKIIFSSHQAQTIMDLFPNLYQTKFIRKIFPSIDQFMASNAEYIRFISNKCRSRINVENTDSKPCCVFDYFWRYRYQDEPEIESDEKFLNVVHSMYDLYNAGIDTTTNLLGFCCLFLGYDDDLQNEIKTEIEKLVDDYKFINMEMRKNCPKLLSFIDEVQRYCNIVPGGVHRVSETCILRGYKIEPCDVIIGDFASVSHDPVTFKNPDMFDPYRFLNDSGKIYIPNKSLIPFGIGKRACLGESIAKMELFLFLSKIIFRFKIVLSDETRIKKDDIVHGIFGIVHAPLTHEVIFKPYNMKI